MSFDLDLQAAQDLATEYTRALRSVQGMSVAEDHDPSWNEASAAELDALRERMGTLGHKLAAELARIGREHPDAWRRYLSASVERLQLLAQHEKPLRMASYEAGQWARWLGGEVPEDAAEIFARGVRVLAEHRELVDQLLRA